MFTELRVEQTGVQTVIVFGWYDGFGFRFVITYKIGMLLSLLRTCSETDINS